MRMRVTWLAVAAIVMALLSQSAAAGDARSKVIAPVPWGAVADQAQVPKAPPPWDRWTFLLGEWVGEGSGNPGEGSARFSFALDLERRILVRKNHNEFPAAAGRPATVHDDLLIVYPEGNQTRAVYFDNEDHVIHYTLEPPAGGNILALVSDKAAAGPRFRLVYSAAGDGTLKIRFDIAPPDKPEAFATYLEGTARRVK